MSWGEVGITTYISRVGVDMSDVEETIKNLHEQRVQIILSIGAFMNYYSGLSSEDMRSNAYEVNELLNEFEEVSIKLSLLENVRLEDITFYDKEKSYTNINKYLWSVYK